MSLIEITTSIYLIGVLFAVVGLVIVGNVPFGSGYYRYVSLPAIFGLLMSSWFGVIYMIIDAMKSKKCYDIELPFYYIPMAKYPDFKGFTPLEEAFKTIKKKAAKELYENSIKPKEKGQPIVYLPYDGRINFDDFFKKTGENMNNSDNVKINGGDLFQWTDSNLNIGHLKENYLKLPLDSSILLDLKSGSYWTSTTLGHDLIEQIKTWLSTGQLRKIREGVSITIVQKTIENENENDDHMTRIQTLIESLEDLGHKIKESYNDHSLAIKQCEADLQYIKDITDS